ncbi:hypothetical protein [Streptomyces sp. SID3212]|uniref:hypothetical protein n=1 Tax=Streptomyces sp. SID3212 TaxID=2690259 RepID=UPI00136D549C|nr:hypothetical protein [Streptomyces sp. SID3212]MYV54446.1 hypothetical protein [Streptomyces sp. SID3212]
MKKTSKTKTIPDAFWNEVRGRHRRLPVWTPGTPMELGDVGRFTTGGWTRFTTLAALGVTADAAEPGPLADFEYASNDGVRRTAALSPATVDAVVASARGDATYHFERAGTFVMRATNASLHRLDDLLAVEDAVLELYRLKKWRKEWVVITEVVTSGPSLVLVSAGGLANVTVRFKAGTQVVPGVPEVAGASVGAAFEVENGDSIEGSYSVPGRTALLWRGFHVVDPLLRAARFAERGSEEEDRDPGGSGGVGGAGGTTDLAPSQEPYCEEIEHLEDIAAPDESSPADQ